MDGRPKCELFGQPGTTVNGRCGPCLGIERPAPAIVNLIRNRPTPRLIISTIPALIISI